MFRLLGVWIDHARAHIVELGDGGKPCCRSIDSHVEPRHRSTGQRGVRPPGHVGGNIEARIQHRRARQIREFYKLVTQRLGNCDALLVLGPGQAKGEFRQHLRKRPALAAKLVGVEPADRMTPAQIVMRLRRLLTPLTTVPVKSARTPPVRVPSLAR